MESIKTWHIMREGIKSMIKANFSNLSNEEVERILAEIERECAGLPAEAIAACAYRKIGELKMKYEQKR
jgi:hypothetical protein